MRVLTYGLAGAGLLSALLVWRALESSYDSEVPFEAKSKPPGAAPLCPWRSPKADRRLFFPESTRHETETRILSGQRLELQQALGRAPAPDESALYLHRVYRQKERLGTVLTRRVKGEFGAIELVLAAGPDGRVRGLRLQRLREPEPIAAALQNPAWLSAYPGKAAADAWQLGRDLPAVPPAAEASARAVVEGVRSLLVLLAAAEQPKARAKLNPHH